jgi:hypothetical protein
MSNNNTASGNDNVRVQISRVRGGKTPKPSAPKKDATFSNIRTGKARVGRQIDVVHGDVNL